MRIKEMIMVKLNNILIANKFSFLAQKEIHREQ